MTSGTVRHAFPTTEKRAARWSWAIISIGVIEFFAIDLIDYFLFQRGILAPYFATYPSLMILDDPTMLLFFMFPSLIPFCVFAFVARAMLLRDSNKRRTITGGLVGLVTITAMWNGWFMLFARNPQSQIGFLAFLWPVYFALTAVEVFIGMGKGRLAFQLVLGAWLMADPWVFAQESPASWSAWAAGIVIVGLAIAGLAASARWEMWVTVAVGVWTAIAPWALGFSGSAVGNMHVIVGMAITLHVAIQFWAMHRPQATASEAA